MQSSRIGYFLVFLLLVAILLVAPLTSELVGNAQLLQSSSRAYSALPLAQNAELAADEAAVEQGVWLEGRREPRTLRHTALPQTLVFAITLLLIAVALIARRSGFLGRLKDGVSFSHTLTTFEKFV